MIPYSYEMVNMGGIDLAEADHTAVDGLYESITEAINACGDVILYNWKFSGIEIAPSHCSVIQVTDAILINGMIQVTEWDEVTVLGMPPPMVPVTPLTATENGVYRAVAPQSGFNPVTVDIQIPEPALTALNVTSNGLYVPETGFIGFNSVTVNVDSISTLQYHLGRLKIDTGAIDESNEYCYSDLVPITTGNGQWFVDLARTDVSSYYIGISLYEEDGTTHTGYVRQFSAYRSYASSGYSNARYLRIANKVSNMTFANLSYLKDSIFIMPMSATQIYKGGIST